MSDPFSNHADDPFLGDGGGGAPVFKFVEIGDTISGVVTKIEQRTDMSPDGVAKTWPDGRPMAVFIFHLDTDDGERRLFVRGNMVSAIKEAAAGRSTIGKQLTVKHHDLGDKKPGKYPAKLYKAKVEDAPARTTKPAPAPAAAAGGDDW